MPNGTAHSATSTMSSGLCPAACQRRLVQNTATRIPAMMHSAYARIGNGPRYQTPCAGLGM